MSMKIPVSNQTLALGNQTAETAPVLTNKREVPDAVAPSIDAAQAQHRAQSANTFAQAVQGLSSQVQRVALEKKATENRNDTINSNIEYRAKVADLQRELEAKQGEDARDVAQEFTTRELLIRNDILEPHNGNVRNSLGNLMATQRFNTTQRLLDHSQKEINQETIAATQRMNEQRFIDILDSPDIEEAAVDGLKFIDEIEDESLPGFSAEERTAYRKEQKSKLNSMVVDNLIADPTDIESLKRGISYYESHKDSMGLKDRARLTNSMAKAGNDVAIFDTYTELDARGLSGDYTAATSWLDENGYSEQIQKAIKARVRENINEVSIARAEKGVELDEKFMAKWSQIDPTEFELRRQALDEFTDGLDPQEQILFDSHRAKYERRIRADAPRIRSSVMGRMRTLLATDPTAYRGELVQAKLAEYQTDGVLTQGDLAVLERKYKEIYAGVDAVSGKSTSSRMPESLPTDILTWAEKEFSLDEDEMFSLKDDFAKWMIASGHSLDPKQYYQQLQEAVTLLVDEDSSALLDKNPDLLSDIMYTEAVLEGTEMPQQVFQQIYGRVLEGAEAQGFEMTPAQAHHIALQTMRESEHVAPEIRSKMRAIYNNNVAETQRMQDEMEYKEEMGLPQSEPLPQTIFAGQERNRPVVENPEARAAREGAVEGRRIESIQAVLDESGVSSGQDFDPATGRDRHLLFTRLKEAGATDAELIPLRAQPIENMTTHEIRNYLSEIWAGTKSFIADSGNETLNDPQKAAQALHDSGAGELIAGTVGQIPSVILDALRGLGNVFTESLSSGVGGPGGQTFSQPTGPIEEDKKIDLQFGQEL